MFQEFATAYKDKNNKVHLFFFPGLDDNNKNIWKKIDLSKADLEYEKIDYDDGSEEFIFEREDISKITCKLIDHSGNTKTIELVI